MDKVKWSGFDDNELFDAYDELEEGYKVEEDSDRDPQAKYPDAIVDIDNTSGNAFGVMGACMRALRRAGATTEDINEYKTEAMSGDYNNLLAVSMKWVSFA